MSTKQKAPVSTGLLIPIAIAKLWSYRGLFARAVLESLELNCKTCHHFAESHENGQGPCKASDDDPRENGLTCVCFCTEFVPDNETYPTHIFPKPRGPLFRYRLYIADCPFEEWEMLSDKEAKKLNDYWRDNPPLGVSREYRKEPLE